MREKVFEGRWAAEEKYVRGGFNENGTPIRLRVRENPNPERKDSIEKACERRIFRGLVGLVSESGL